MDVILNGLSLLHEPDEIIEIRSIDPKPVISGYFRADSPAIAKELSRYPNRTFYQTMNRVKSACYAREQHERLVERPHETTTDGDIAGYQWLLIDADPVRPSGVSASKEEKEAARRVAGMTMKKLMAMGFSEPIVADSGNGYHLLFHIHASPKEKQVLADFLAVLDMWFSTEQVKIDTAVFNPARITKLYGTIATKGASTPERPHRRSGIIRKPEKVEATSMTLIRNIAAERQKAVSPQENPRQRGATSSFDLDQFLSDHHIEVTKKIPISTGMKYQLAECPFDSSHKHGDAAVFAYSNGSYGFHCFHNSCAGYHWHEFREKVDPSAYANSPYTVHQAVSTGAPSRSQPDGAEGSATAVKTGQPRMLDFAEIPNYDRSKIVVIRSRFQALDAKIGGFNKGEMTVWSGGNASGKSTLVSQIGLAAITEGFKVAMFSGEMTASRVREWVLLQAAGPDFVMQDPLNQNHYCLKPGIEEKLDAIAVRIDYITKNPTSACIIPRVIQKEMHPLDAPEQVQLLQSLKGNKNEALIITALFTGMRAGELLGLTWDNVDFDHGVIHIVKQLTQSRGAGHPFAFGTLKNGKTRSINPAPFVLDILKEHKEHQEEQKRIAGVLWNEGKFPNLVFTHEDGSHLSQPTIWKAFQKALEDAGLEHHRLHDCRHTFAVNSIRAGDDIKTIQENMGHYSAAFTLDRYGHVTETMRQESANRMQAFIQGMSGNEGGK